MNRRRLYLLLILIPLPVSLWAIGKDLRYSRLVEAHELQSPGNADFDGDGVLGEIVFEPASEGPANNGRGSLHTSAFVIIKDHGQELMRFAYRHVDSTFRTHIAVDNSFQSAHLLIYDRLDEFDRPPNGVFAWNGHEMAPVLASTAEREILDAMAARDDTGSWNFWAALRLIHLVMAICYYLPLIILWWFSKGMQIDSGAITS